jgi:hypothetical protein
MMDPAEWDHLAREHQQRVLEEGRALAEAAVQADNSTAGREREPAAQDFDAGLEPRRPRRATNEPLWYNQPMRRH